MAKPFIFICHKRKLLIIFLVLTLLIALLRYSVGTTIKTLAPFTYSISGEIVIIDPGHGGPDGGAKGVSGTIEKDLTLDIALRLKRVLGMVGVQSVMTRTDDSDLARDGVSKIASRKREDLAARAEIGNSTEASVFISIHANSFPESKWSGAQTFYYPGDEESKVLASFIQEALVRELGPNNRKEMAADLYLLRNIQKPAVIIEVGFLSNPEEERLLSYEEYREDIALAIRKGLEAYFQDKDSYETSESEHTKTVMADEDHLVLYLLKSDDSTSGLVPVFKEIQQDITPEDKVHKVLSTLLSEPEGDRLPIFTQGTAVNEIYISNGIVYIDFDGDNSNFYGSGSIAELMGIYSIVNSLCLIPGIYEVRFSVDNEIDPSLGKHIFFDSPFRINMDLVMMEY